MTATKCSFNYENVRVYTREGNCIIEYDPNNHRRPYTRFLYQCSPNYPSDAPSDQRIVLEPSLQMRDMPIPLAISDWRGEIEWRYVNIPYHPHCSVPAAILWEHPDIEVHIQYFASQIITGVLLQKNGKDFFSTLYPTAMCFRGTIPVVFQFANEYGLHNTKTYSELALSHEMSICLDMLLRYNDHKPSQWATTIASLYLAWRHVSCVGTSYHHNGRVIPQHLIDDGIIDIANFDESIDGFTLEMSQ